MEKLLNDLKNQVISHLRKGDDLDKPYFGKGQKTYSKNDIINEIENNTDDGVEFLKNLVMLSLDLFDRGKEKLNNYEKS